jgi:hypothetical protein
MKNKNFDDFSSRKDIRRKQINNKSLEKRSKKFEDEDSKNKKSSLRRQREEMSADEIWEDWEEDYDI